MKFGIYAWFGYPLPMRTRASMIRRAGFDFVMLWWGDERSSNPDEAKEKLPELFRKEGLEIENVHMPYAGVNDLWLDKTEGEAVFGRLASCIEDCGTHGIPSAVMHPTSGDTPPPFSEIGFDRIRRLVGRAEECHVNLALENMRRPEYMDPVFSRIESDRLKFCYDSGHENCFTPATDILGIYGRRLVTMHLHDNNGRLDQHRLPFNGTVPWGRVTERLSSLGWEGPLCFESDASLEALREYTAEEYLNEVIGRARKLEGMMRSSKNGASREQCPSS